MVGTPRRDVVVTMGDPCGIGPEVAVKALLASPALRARCLLVGDPGVLARALARVRPRPRLPAGLHLLSRPDARLASLRPGRPSAAAGAAAARWLAEGVALVIRGAARALVTGPVSKEAVAATLPGFRGQTEFIARAAGVREPVMLLAGPTLRTVPVTRHLPLRRVVPALSVGLIARAIRVTAEGLRRWFGVPRPRIAVCGVNPHAGEGGLLGSEDGRIVAPAVRRARRGGLRVTGPLPADVVFAAMRRGSYDAVVAMYHDQANIPIKTVEGARAVNATLGLPFLRTSPAHGTAFDIAGRGIADPTSMLAAVGTAAAAC